MSRSKEDWSDSDDEDGLEEGYTSVHLGIPSDVIDLEDDLHDPYVSRIGGTPAFFSYPNPSPDASKCKICQEPSELLVQMLCNLEDSPFERALYVWGCSRPSCQRKDGAIRAWRALRYDEKYAKKLDRKREKKRQQEEAKKVSDPVKPIVNPFSSSSSNPFAARAGTDTGFGFGDSIMGFNGDSGTSPTKPLTKAESDSGEGSSVEEDSDDELDSPVEELSSKLQTASFGPSVDWSILPQYTPIYLETESEYLPPPPKVKPMSTTQVDSGSSGGEWSKELWEESHNVDDIFIKFTARVDARPKQCVRYELGGTPLFYQLDTVYRALHSAPTGSPVPVTGSAFAVSNTPFRRVYNPLASSILPKCPICSSPRRFECQLMPNLINALKRSPGQEAGNQMEWGTCFVFTCDKDCSQVNEGGEKRMLKYCWREEIVLVQWEE